MNRCANKHRTANSGLTVVQFSIPQTHLQLIKHSYPTSTFVAQIATFAKRQKIAGRVWIMNDAPYIFY